MPDLVDRHGQEVALSCQRRGGGIEVPSGSTIVVKCDAPPPACEARGFAARSHRGKELVTDCIHLNALLRSRVGAADDVAPRAKSAGATLTEGTAAEALCADIETILVGTDRFIEQCNLSG